MNQRSDNSLRSLFHGLVALVSAMAFCYSCASVGQIEGGDYDEAPPVLLSASPAEGALNVSKNKVTLSFDEYVKLDKPSEKVIVSPPQLQTPEVTASGKRVIVTLRDSLIAGTTYSIDFGDAIQDNNEGNPLEAFTYTFSTGDHIDTMAVAGKILNASDLEPVKGMLVGLYSDLSDTVFMTRQFDRVGRTDSRGYFSIYGVAPGSYHIYALEDADQNFYYSMKSEAIAFSDSIIIPRSERRSRMDTTWVDSLTIDTIQQVEYTYYLPDNIFLRRFRQVDASQRLARTERPLRKKFTLSFTADQDSLPLIEGIGFDATDAFVVDYKTQKNDTLDYWIRDSLLYSQDTLSVKLTYLYTDTLDQLVPRTDTLKLVSKEKVQSSSQTKKGNGNRSKKDEQEDEETVPSLEVTTYAPTTLDIYDYLSFSLQEPVGGFDGNLFHLYQRVDTLYEEVPFDLSMAPRDVKTLELYADWEAAKDYKLVVDPAAITGLYGLSNEKIEKLFSIRKLEDYGQVFFNVTGAMPGSFVELLNTRDEVIRTVTVEDGRADFYYLTPGKYGARLIEDANGNGKWDTGNLKEHLQPEMVLYYPQVIEFKANFDVTQDWDVNQKAIDAQKPEEMIKQKPETKKKVSRNNP